MNSKKCTLQKKVFFMERKPDFLTRGLDPLPLKMQAVSLLIYNSSIAQYTKGLKNPRDKP